MSTFKPEPSIFSNEREKDRKNFTVYYELGTLKIKGVVPFKCLNFHASWRKNGKKDESWFAYTLDYPRAL